MKAESIAECCLGAFCNTFDLHWVIICLENQFWSSYLVAAKDRFYSTEDLINFLYTVKPVKGHSKIDKTKVLRTNGSLMKVEIIAECSLLYF